MSNLNPWGHLNGHILAAIDTETTGPDLRKHEICEISIIPLTIQMEPMCLPFDMILQPYDFDAIDKEALAVNGITMQELERGVPQDRAAEMLVGWFEKLNAPVGKRLVPLAHNWAFDSAFIKMWLGYRTYTMIFDGRYRDTMVSASFINDWAGYNREPYPYPKVNLRYLAGTLRIETERLHRAMDDARITFQCYDELVKRGTTFGVDSREFIRSVNISPEDLPEIPTPQAP